MGIKTDNIVSGNCNKWYMWTLPQSESGYLWWFIFYHGDHGAHWEK